MNHYELLKASRRAVGALEPGTTPGDIRAYTLADDRIYLSVAVWALARTYLRLMFPRCALVASHLAKTIPDTLPLCL